MMEALQLSTSKGPPSLIMPAWVYDRGFNARATSLTTFFPMSVQVYKAHWMGADVAVKVVELDKLRSTVRDIVVDGVEATAMKSLTHPNVSKPACCQRVLRFCFSKRLAASE